MVLLVTILSIAIRALVSQSVSQSVGRSVERLVTQHPYSTVHGSTLAAPKATQCNSVFSWCGLIHKTWNSQMSVHRFVSIDSVHIVSPHRCSVSPWVLSKSSREINVYSLCNVMINCRECRPELLSRKCGRVEETVRSNWNSQKQLKQSEATETVRRNWNSQKQLKQSEATETVRRNWNSQKQLKQSEETETVRRNWNSQKKLKQSEETETAVKTMDGVRKIKEKISVFTSWRRISGMEV